MIPLAAVQLAPCDPAAISVLESVIVSVTSGLGLSSPPPAGDELPLSVTLDSDAAPAALYRPPPARAARLPLKVVLVAVSTPDEMSTAPPTPTDDGLRGAPLAEWAGSAWLALNVSPAR